MEMGPRLICPRCRRVENNNFIYYPLRTHTDTEARAGHLNAEESLTCEGCGAVYPVIEGVAVVLPEVGMVDGAVITPWWPQGWGLGVWKGLLEGRDTRAGFGEMVGRVGRYVWSGFRDCFGGPWHTVQPGVHAVQVLEWAQAQGWRGQRHLVVGGGSGRELWETPAREGGLSILMDFHLPGLLASKRLWEQGMIEIPLMGRVGGDWRIERVQSPSRPQGVQVGWVCGDVLNPPFEADAFDAISALNVLDSVADPYVMLGQCHALLAEGGGLVLSSPFAWHDEVTPRAQRLNDEIGLREVLGRFQPGMHLASNQEFDWLLRHTDREAALYRSKAFFFRKLGISDTNP